MELNLPGERLEHLMMSPLEDFESSVSTNSATRANYRKYYVNDFSCDPKYYAITLFSPSLSKAAIISGSLT